MTTIRSTIKTYLDTLVWSWKPFKACFDYYTSKSESWYPFVMFEPSNDTLQAEYEDTEYNKRTYNFDVTIIQEMTQTSRQEAVTRIIAWFDAVINVFDKNFTMWWTVKMVNAMQWAIGEADLWEWPSMFATMKISCVILHSIE